MAKREKPQPRLLVADIDGNIYDHPDLLMLCRRGDELAQPRPDEIMPLPEESEFFLLPGRYAVGFDAEEGMVETLDDLAVAAFVCPGHTVTGIAAYDTEEGAPILPLLSYAAIGYAEGKFWVCAKKVDEDRRQIFTRIGPDKVSAGAHALIKQFPDNRLVRHLTGCALTSSCPAAKNLSIGRFEAPLPTAKTCNARCVGCISLQDQDSGFPSPQNRIAFTPTADEIVQIMLHHSKRERHPILSFGQGCEGEPLTGAALLAEATRKYREAGGKGTVNVNTNASLPDAVTLVAEAGMDSMRVSLNSARKGPYEAYYRPNGYVFEDVVQSIRNAKAGGMFVSLNYLFFPGVSDTEFELDALTALVEETRLDFIQLRNLNLDPELYLDLMDPFESGPSMGFTNFKKRLKKSCDWLEFGYFNPFLGDR
ncbi:MAG: radical SAM protein [Proteobacteria bacterium]|nr:radical SAM protein [Pseudomonadota bacterium]